MLVIVNPQKCSLLLLSSDIYCFLFLRFVKNFYPILFLDGNRVDNLYIKLDWGHAVHSEIYRECILFDLAGKAAKILDKLISSVFLSYTHFGLSLSSLFPNVSQTFQFKEISHSSTPLVRGQWKSKGLDDDWRGGA